MIKEQLLDSISLLDQHYCSLNGWNHELWVHLGSSKENCHLFSVKLHCWEHESGKEATWTQVVTLLVTAM